MRPIGFSTGAIARGNFSLAVKCLRDRGIDVIELSALRVCELRPLLDALPSLDLHAFRFLSIHVPSRFDEDEEAEIVDELRRRAAGIPIVVHPDTIFNPSLWAKFGEHLLIENMDKRKPVGRTTKELLSLFRNLDTARLCLDIGHARQVDPSMMEAVLLAREFGSRLAEVHISEVNTASRHDPISTTAIQAFQMLADYIPENIPIVIESLVDAGQSTIEAELENAREALCCSARVLAYS